MISDDGKNVLGADRALKEFMTAWNNKRIEELFLNKEPDRRFLHLQHLSAMERGSEWSDDRAATDQIQKMFFHVQWVLLSIF